MSKNILIVDDKPEMTKVITTNYKIIMYIRKEIRLKLLHGLHAETFPILLYRT